MLRPSANVGKPLSMEAPILGALVITLQYKVGFECEEHYYAL